MENIVNQIKFWLKEILEEENGCNEGSLVMHYDEIIFSLDYLLKLWNSYVDAYDIRVNGYETKD